MRATLLQAGTALGAARDALLKSRAWWLGLDHWKRHFVFNVLIGIVIEVVLHLLGRAPVVVAAENWAMDVAMRVSADFQPHATGAPSVTIIDVDEETWRDPAWGGGEPYRAPRNNLLQLIRCALGKGAHSVVVDVIIEDPEGPGDQIFVSEMEKLAADPSLAKRHQHVLFVRTLREPLIAPDLLAPVLRKSPLDDVIRHSNGVLINVAPYFETSRDGLVRRWRLWTPACEPNDIGPPSVGHWRVLPSVQLALESLKEMVKDAPWDMSASLGPCLLSAEALNHLGDKDFPNFPLEKNAEKSINDINDQMLRWLRKHLELTHQPVEPARSEGFDPSSRIFFGDRFPPNGARVQVVSALKLLPPDGCTASASPNVRLPPTWGDVIIIGQSAEAARDEHETPVGAMPGTMVIANALQSLDVRGVIQPLGEPWSCALMVFSILLVAFAFAYFDSNLGVLLIGVPFVLLLIWISYDFLKRGYWADFAVPLLAIYAHRVVKGFEEYFSLRKITARHSRTGTNPSEGDSA
jgi:CHASE2 domain-containing sensor protein